MSAARTLGLGALLLAACGGTSAPDAGSDAGGYDGGPPPPTCAQLMHVDLGVPDGGDAGLATGLSFALTVGEEDVAVSSVVTPWRDGDTVALVHGFQGGWMVTPALDIDTTAPVPTDSFGSACFDVLLTNDVPGATGVHPTTMRGTLARPVAGRPHVFHAVALLDLLSFDPAAVDGQALHLGIDVAGLTGVGHAALTVTPRLTDAGP